MKKKILKKALILLFAITLLIGSTISSYAVTCDHYSNLQSVVTKSPTCTEPGSIVLSCKKCGLIISNSTLPATGHNWYIHEENESYILYWCSNTGCQWASIDWK